MLPVSVVLFCCLVLFHRTVTPQFLASLVVDLFPIFSDYERNCYKHWRTRKEVFNDLTAWISSLPTLHPSELWAVIHYVSVLYPDGDRTHH